MDSLKNKTRRDYDYLSRYAAFPFYYNVEDNKYIYGLSKQLKQVSSYVVINIDMSCTLESLAVKYYGRPDYYWIIADYNRIQDPFLPLYPRYTTLKLPSISAIAFEE